MTILARFADSVDWLNERIGRTVSWLVLIMALVTFAVAILRYVFSIGFVWMQESYVWLHAIVFMSGAAYTLLHDAHVRVDVIYRPFGARYKAWVDLLGGLLLLLPVVVAAGWVSFPYVLTSWDKWETSREAGGLPALFLLKSFLLVFCATIGLQGLSLSARSLILLKGPPDQEREA